MEKDKIVSLVAQTAVKIASSKEKVRQRNQTSIDNIKSCLELWIQNWVKGEFKEKVLIE